MTSPAAPPLRLLLRVANVVLAGASLLLIGHAIWLAREYRHSGPAPGPEPGLDDGSGMAFGGLLSLLALVAGGRSTWRLAAPWLAAAAASFPWFIYLQGGMGVYCLCTALCGLAGVKRDRHAHMSVHIVLLVVLVLATACATLLLLTNNSLRDRIPDDPSGAWRDALAWMDANARGARLAAVGALLAELALLGAACSLQAIYSAAYEAWLDDCEEQGERVREALARTVVQTHAGGSGSSWSARLLSKYGVEASALEAATLDARQVAALQDDRA